MDDDRKRTKRAKRGPRALQSADALFEQAVRYLERFDCTTTRMERYLKDKLRAAHQAGVSPADGDDWIPEVVARLVRVRYLDDQRFATGRAGALHRRGKARRAITMDLKGKGLKPDVIAAALESLKEDLDDDSDPELIAAITLARKRRLGPFYQGDDRRERRQKHLATLARAGFSFDMARRVVDAPEPDEIS